METFWFFWLRFRLAYDSAYDSDWWFSLVHKRSYDSAYDSDSDSVASENQFLSPGLTRTGSNWPHILSRKSVKIQLIVVAVMGVLNRHIKSTPDN